MTLRFEWDVRKALLNLRKHRVSFEEARTVFGDPLSLTIADPDHEIGEFRFVIVGRSVAGRLMVVSHAENDETIRIISARRATRHEREFYEQGEAS